MQNGFPDPITGVVNTHGMTNSAWGMMKLGLEKEEQFKKLLLLVIDNLESCEHPGLALALDCCAAVTSDVTSLGLDTSRLIKLVENIYKEASGQNIVRYMYSFYVLNIHEADLQCKLAERLIEVADNPQQCSNAVLVLSRQGIEAERLAQKLASKLLELGAAGKPQHVANVFMAAKESGWVLDRHLATSLVRTYQEVHDRDAYQGVAQLLEGLEKHGVCAADVDLDPMVRRLLDNCPDKLRSKLSGVRSSLEAIGYCQPDLLRQLEQLVVMGK